MQISPLNQYKVNNYTKNSAPKPKNNLPAFGIIIKNEIPKRLYEHTHGLKDSYLCLISGPSGVGKDSVIRMFNDIYSYFNKVVTCTTRKMRAGEVNGKDYHFLTNAEFKDAIKNGEFIEYQNVYADVFYGSRTKDVQEALKGGKSVVMNVDVEGAKEIRAKMPDALTVFIMPPSPEALAQRLIKRGTEDEKSLALRIAKAEWEISHANNYDVVVSNEELSKCVNELAQVLQVSQKL